MTKFRRILEEACLTGSELESQAPFNSPSGGKLLPPLRGGVGRGLFSVLTVVAFMALCLSAFAQFPPMGMNGDGTQGNPYQITDSMHLRVLADYVNAGNGNSTAGVYYKLMNDIDLSGYSAGTGWKPIGTYNIFYMHARAFQGNFNGDGYVITNLMAEYPVVNNSANNYIGLFGYIWNAKIDSLGIASGSVTGYQDVGGLVGLGDLSTITNCYTACNVNGCILVGGLVGKSVASVINSCYVISDSITGLADIGGLVGETDSSTLTNCYATCNINANGDRIGGLVGKSLSGSSIFANCYATGNVTGTAIGSGEYVGGLIGYCGAINNSTAVISIKNCHATGNITGNYCVGGLVGTCPAIKIKNSTIEDCYATGNVASGKTVAGGLAGSTGFATLTNCYATGNVIGEVVCGLVVYNSSGAIFTNCYATGDITATNINDKDIKAGGLVISNNGTLKNCYATGNISGTEQYTSIGGLVCTNSSTGIIDGCYATGNIIGGQDLNNDYQFTGGLVGSNEGTIKNCYAEGDVTGETSWGVGGLVGWNSSIITKCYATGNVASGTVAGGLVGRNGGNVTDCFFDKETSGQTNGIGYNYGTYGTADVTGKSTAEMMQKTTFTAANWDFNTIWKICEEETYPFFQWQEDIVCGGVSFVAVTNISNVPSKTVAGIYLTLIGIAQPSNATYKSIVWSVKNAGATGASLSGNTLYAATTGTLTLTATIANGAAIGTDYTQDFNIEVISEDDFVPVTNIGNVPSQTGTSTPLALTGTVSPSDATFQTIVWVVKDAGTTGAGIYYNTLYPSAAGTATVTATIANGKAIGTPYTQDFNIEVKPTGIVSTTLNNQLRVYPNPAKNQLTIEYGSSACFGYAQQSTLTAQERPLSEVEVDIYNVVGQKLNNCQFSIVNSQLSILNCQFSINY